MPLAGQAHVDRAGPDRQPDPRALTHAHSSSTPRSAQGRKGDSADSLLTTCYRECDDDRCPFTTTHARRGKMSQPVRDERLTLPGRGQERATMLYCARPENDRPCPAVVVTCWPGVRGVTPRPWCPLWSVSSRGRRSAWTRLTPSA